MRRRIHEQHLSPHQLRDRAQFLESHSGKLFQRRRAVGRELMQHRDDIRISRYDPGVKIRVPMHGGLGPQPPVKWVGISKHLRVEQVIQAEGGRGRP